MYLFAAFQYASKHVPLNFMTRCFLIAYAIGSQSGVRGPPGGEKIGVWGRPSSDKNFKKLRVMNSLKTRWQ